MFKWLHDPTKVTKQPMKVRFDGVPPGSPEAHQLGQALRPQINHFLMSQVQQQRTSEMSVYKKHATYPGLEMSFSHIHGQEILHINVTAELKHELLKKVEETPWDWVVLDIVIPQFLYTYVADSTPSSTSAVFFAKVVAPQPSAQPKPRPEAEYGEAGENSPAELYSAERNPILQWAYTPLDPQVGEWTEDSDVVEMGSLLIDMREFHAYEEMVIELYVGFETMSDDFVPTGYGAPVYYGDITMPAIPGGLLTPATLTQTTGPQVVGYPNPYTDYVDNSQIPTDLPHHGLGTAWPPFNLDLFTGYLVDTNAAFDVFIPQGLSEQVGVFTTTWNFYENQLHHVYAPEYQYEYLATPVVPSGTAELRAVMIRGDFDWAWSVHLTPNFLDFGRWEDARIFPNRFGVATIATDVPIAAQGTDNGRANNYGLNLIGRLSVSPKHGGFSFKRA